MAMSYGNTSYNTSLLVYFSQVQQAFLEQNHNLKKLLVYLD